MGAAGPTRGAAGRGPRPGAAGRGAVRGRWEGPPEGTTESDAPLPLSRDRSYLSRERGCRQKIRRTTILPLRDLEKVGAILSFRVALQLN
jgi:hypothetical protein